MEEVYHREAMDEFNRPIKLKNIYEVGEDDSILIVKGWTKQNVEDEIGIEKIIMRHTLIY